MSEDISEKGKKIKNDVKNLSDSDLVHLITVFRLEQDRRDREAKALAMSQIKAIAVKAGITVSLADKNLEPQKKGAKLGAKAKVKYRSATGEEWSGRGKKPKWIIDYIASGQKLEDLLTAEFKLD
jgi:DNA-binding protein H-NS